MIVKLLRRTEGWRRTRRGPWALTAACVLIGGSAVANFGPSGDPGMSYIGPVPNSWFQGQPCPEGPIHFSQDPNLPEIHRWEIDPVGVEEDGDPNTYLRCRLLRPVESILCQVGLADGSVVSCNANEGPYQLPQDGEVVLMSIDTYLGAGRCEVHVSTGYKYGIADPKCRAQGGGGGSGGSSGSSSTCNAANAAAVLTTGQMTTIASDACVRLVNESSWSTINPKIQAMSGTASYPVPFTATSCSGSSTGSLTGNWVERFLVDGFGVTPNNYCDVFVKLQGNGSQVQFSYFQ